MLGKMGAPSIPSYLVREVANGPGLVLVEDKVDEWCVKSCGVFFSGNGGSN